MNRRQLLKGFTGLAGLAYLQPALSADGVIAYTPEIFEHAVAGGEPFMLDFYASW